MHLEQQKLLCTDVKNDQDYLRGQYNSQYYSLMDNATERIEIHNVQCILPALTDKLPPHLCAIQTATAEN